MTIVRHTHTAGRRPQRRSLSVGVATLALAALCCVAGAQPERSEDDPVLSAGDPPLRQSDVAAWQRILEFAFGATLDANQKQLLQERLIAQWAEAADRARAEVLSAKETWRQVSQAVGPQREVMRIALREGVLTAARGDPEEPANKLILDLWDARSPILVPGDPPLRKGSAEALIALFEWLASRAVNETCELTEAERDDVLLQLARQYPRSAPGDRMLLEHTEELLHWLQREWETASPEARGHFRANLADLFGLPQPLLPAPFVGEVDTWEHPEGLFSVPFPADWAVRYSALPEGTEIAGWQLMDVTALGDAPAAALELGALPAAGALLVVGVLPPEVREGEMTLQETVFAFSATLLGLSGEPEPLAQSVSGDQAALMAWQHRADDRDYLAWVSAVKLPKPEGAAVVVVARAPALRTDEYGPAFSRIVYGIRLGDGGAVTREGESFSDLLGLPDGRDVTIDLFSMPLRGQMDLVEDLTSGIK